MFDWDWKIENKNYKLNFSKAVLLENFERRDIKREQYYPIKITKEGALPLEFHGSAHMQSLTHANGIMKIEKGIEIIKKGESVNVRPI